MAGRRWTPEEIEFLRDMYGTYKPETIAKKLNRTVDAVQVRAGVLHLGRRRPADVYSMNELQEMLGMDAHTTVTRWVSEGLLRAVTRPRYGRRTRREWWIRERDIIRFLREHPHQVPDAGRVQPPFRQYIAEPWITFVEAFRRGAAWPFFLENAAKAGLLPEARKRGSTGTMWVMPLSSLPPLIEARRRMTDDIKHRRLVRQYDQQQAKGAVKRKMSHLNKAAREKAS